MNNKTKAQNRLSPLDNICYQRIKSPNFAQKIPFIQKVKNMLKGVKA